MRALLVLLVLLALSCGGGGRRERREAVARRAVANLYPGWVVVEVEVGGGCSERASASVVARDPRTGAVSRLALRWNERTRTIDDD